MNNTSRVKHNNKHQNLKSGAEVTFLEFTRQEFTSLEFTGLEFTGLEVTRE